MAHDLADKVPDFVVAFVVVVVNVGACACIILDSYYVCTERRVSVRVLVPFRVCACVCTCM